MTDTPSMIVVGVSLFLVAVILFATDVLPFLMEHLLQPAIRWFQRVFLGIDAARVGDDALIDSIGVAHAFKPDDDGVHRGSVVVDGETWQATSDLPTDVGARVQVLAREKLILRVKQITDA